VWLEAWPQAEATLETPTTNLERARIELVTAVWQAAADDRGKLLLGASELIRVADRFAPPLAVRAYANRGLAGIDGTIATAMGMSIADSGRRVRVLLGDLALLHDAGSLNLSGLSNTNIQLIVGNDRGGGIFRSLEIAKLAAPEVFDRLFITPQEVDIATLAKAFGWNYQAATAENLPELLKLSGPVLIDFAL
jgi:2-succinyl-5-enolpyruvyl-6-hydroxy-3-cyclohexene-1-carboxylate synthase